MSLRDLIRMKASGANAANDANCRVSLAGLAASGGWQWFHCLYPDGRVVELVCCPDTTPSDVVAQRPDCIEVRPVQRPTYPTAPARTSAPRARIEAWLAHIGETDAGVIADVLNAAAADAEMRADFLRRANEVFEAPQAAGSVLVAPLLHQEPVVVA